MSLAPLPRDPDCPHVDRRVYALGRCQTCYMRHYHRLRYRTSRPVYRPRRCLGCGLERPYSDFPLGRRRKNGARYPMHYCSTCLALPIRIGGGREALRRADRLFRRRRPRGFILGPAACQDCREPVYFNGAVWLESAGVRHACRGAVAA